MILVHKRQFLWHSVVVRMCSEEQRSKGFRRNFSLVLVLGGGNQSEEAHDFYHGFTCDGHTVLLFDH